MRPWAAFTPGCRLRRRHSGDGERRRRRSTGAARARTARKPCTRRDRAAQDRRLRERRRRCRILDLISRVARIDRLRDRMSAGKNAPLGKNESDRGVAFTLAAATAERVRGIAFSYDECTSGRRIYAYVGGNPISYTDPEGLQPPGPRLLGQGTWQILPPGPLGVLPGQPGYVFPLVPPPLTPHQKCMLKCDLVLGSPCKYIALQTPGMPYGPAATYLACNYVAHEICASRCNENGSCSPPWNDPGNPDFPRIPPMAMDPHLRR
jgi:hypothetical protein